MFTALLETTALWLPVITALLTVGIYFVLVLFLYAIAEAINKIRPENRDITSGKVWLNLIPVFNLVWMFVTVSRFASSVQKEYEARDFEEETDGGKRLGLLFASSVVLCLVPGINLLAIPAAIVLWILYWGRVVQIGKTLENSGETVFFEKYNSRLEFPTSLSISAFCFVAMICAAFAIWELARIEGEKESIPIRLVEGGEDDTGRGSPGSGGQEDPLNRGELAPKKEDFAELPQTNLPEVMEDLKDILAMDDPNLASPISEEKLHAYAALDEAIRDKLLGQQRGSGNASGRGDTGQFGSGPGGDGADSTRARSLRWVLRFRTVDGKDYLNQLKSLGGIVLVPLSSDRKRMYIFRDLDNPRPGTLATDSDYNQLAGLIQFSDFRRESTQQVGQALGLDFQPNVFWAFFPTSLEKELAKLEVQYRNRRPQDVESTTFQVSVRNGRFKLEVTDQKVKRRR